MDRVFVFSKYGLEDKYNDDFRLMYSEMKRIASKNLDYVLSEESFEIDIKNIKRKNHGEPEIVIPVGAIQFVKKYLDFYGKEMKPIEIPDSMYDFLGRMYIKLKGSEVLKHYTYSSKWFVKDISSLKYWNSSLYDGDISKYICKDRDYSVSQKMDIVSEYRVFVLEDNVLAVQMYAGNPLVFPDSDKIIGMVNNYRKEKHPKAYTLDIAVVKKEKNMETVPLEVHPFVSCGLYGYIPDSLDKMLEYGYRWYLEGN